MLLFLLKIYFVSPTTPGGFVLFGFPGLMAYQPSKVIQWQGHPCRRNCIDNI